MKGVAIRILFLCAWLTFPAMGQVLTAGTNSYTLAECLRIGMKTSATALNARRDEAIAESLIKQTRAEAFPTLGINGSYTRLDETQSFDLGEGPVEIGSADNYSVTVSLTQLLYSGGKVKAALDSEDAMRLRAKAMRGDAEARLVFNIKKLFYDILLLQAGLEVRTDSVQQLTDLVKQTEARFAARTASEFDMVSARVKLANERPLLIAERGHCAIATESLRRLLNLDKTPFVLDGELSFGPRNIAFQKVERQAILVRPGLLAMAAVVELCAADIKSARSQGLPRVNAFVNYNGANSYGFASFEDQWGWHWNAGVALTWNVWDSGLTGGRVDEKKLVYEKALTELDDLRKAVRLELTQANLNRDQAREQVKSGQENVSLAEKGLSIARARLDGGLGTTLEFSDANLGVKTAKLTLLTALRDHMTALAQLEYASGMTLEEMEELNEGRQEGAAP